MDYDNTSAEENAKKQIQGAVGLRNVNLCKAYNEAEATKLKGKSEVASILAQGMAKAEGYKKLSESLTPEILKAKAFEKWDGAPPKRILIGDGNESMMIQLPATQQVTVPAKAAPSKT